MMKKGIHGLMGMIVFIIFITGCRTVDPIEKKGTLFPAPFSKKYAELFYTMNRESQLEELVKMIDPETSANFDKPKLNDVMRSRSDDIVSKKEKFQLEVMQEISPQDDFRFVYLLKKEDYGFWGRKYRRIRIDRIICVKRGEEWFIYGPEKPFGEGLGVETVFLCQVKDLLEKEDQSSFLRKIIEEDYSQTKFTVFTHEMPDRTREEVVEELMQKGIQLYDGENYREALRLFKKAFDISQGRSQKAETYIKRCQKAIEMGF
ncbi:MAG: hypothetical protein JW928_03235 [Candidatus Aureabacteria bacterium]|nr:hypothetical protein [Candidatus Auribacterota bacterium]